MASMPPLLRQQTSGWAPEQETGLQTGLVSFIKCAVSRSGGRPGMGTRPHYRDEGSQEEVTPTWDLPIKLL